MKKLVTHNGKYHTDDIFACATIQLMLDNQKIDYEIIRTRDDQIIKTGDYVFDVGGIYDPTKNRFDHHQKEGAGERVSKIPYASFGLVWKHFGMELCPSLEVFNEIDLKIVSGIDAIDNGVSIVEYIYTDVKDITFHDIASSFMPSWKNSSEEAFHQGFLQSVHIAKNFLTRTITYLSDLKEGEDIVISAYHAATDKRLIILDIYYHGKDRLSDYSEPLFVIFPDTINNRWMISTVRDKDAQFLNRKDLPSNWGGLRDQELAEASGVSGAVFCHKGLFLAAADSKEGALELARIALNS